VSKSIQGQVTPLLFILEGAFWFAMIATGSGVLVGWAAVTSFASGAALLGAPSSPVSKPLAGASVLFGLTLTIYQIYAAASILATTQSMVGAYSAGLFAVFTVVYLYLLARVFAPAKPS
jgi:hypothetical protein